MDIERAMISFWWLAGAADGESNRVCFWKRGSNDDPQNFKNVDVNSFAGGHWDQLSD